MTSITVSLGLHVCSVGIALHAPVAIFMSTCTFLMSSFIWNCFWNFCLYNKFLIYHYILWMSR